MATDHVIGFDCILYYNSATHASPTWVAINQTMDVSVDISAGEVDITTRETVFKLTGMGLIDAAFNFGYLHTLGADTVFNALIAACRLTSSPAPVQLAAMDQAIATSGAKGLRAFCVITGLPQSQNLEEGVKYDFTAKPTRHVESSAVVAPDWYVVS